MNYKSINFAEKLNLFNEHWQPKVISEMNNYQFKIAKIKGEFIKHQHSDTDEVFIVIEGKMNIEFEKNTIEIKSGEMIVVPKGVMHKFFNLGFAATNAVKTLNLSTEIFFSYLPICHIAERLLVEMGSLYTRREKQNWIRRSRIC